MFVIRKERKVDFFSCKFGFWWGNLHATSDLFLKDHFVCRIFCCVLFYSTAELSIFWLPGPCFPHHCCDLWSSCLENSMNRGSWWATVHEVANSQTRLSMHTHFRSQYLASSWVSCLNPEVLHSRHHPPSLCSCAALGKKFPLHSRHHSTSIIPKGGFLSLLQLRKQAHQM